MCDGYFSDDPSLKYDFCPISGIHQYRQDLPFDVRDRNSVCCDAHYIYIICYKPRQLSVYNLAAKHLCTIPFTQLGIPSGGELHAIVRMQNEHIIIAAGSTIKLHRYRVE